MSLKKSVQGRYFGLGKSLFLFLAGLVLCVLTLLFNIYVMGSRDAVEGNYFISRSYVGLSYIQFCWIIFSLLFVLGGWVLFRGTGKMYSAVLIVCCLAIVAHTTIMKAAMRKGHLLSISTLESALERAKKEPSAEPFIAASMSESQDRYQAIVDRWNEVERETYEPKQF